MDHEELTSLTARAMAKMVSDREVSAVELLDAHLAQIERYNSSVNAIVTLVADEARVRAHKADQKTLSGETLGILHGIPIAHKDTHRTKGIRTTFGSPLHADNVPSIDDLIIDRLSSAGAISIGKTNTPEFAAGSHTFNKVFGATRNPYDLSRTPGGSSGGAAVALALGMHPLADGSDMGASVRNPASFCNVVGLRPSFGRVPNYPASVPDERLSVPGALARSVGDVALMMQAISGPDPRVPYARAESGEIFAGLSSARPTSRRVAWAPDLGGMIGIEPEVLEALARCPSIFTDLGWEVVDSVPDLSGADETFRVLRAMQFAQSFGNIVDHYPDMVKEAIRWNVSVGRALSDSEISKAKTHQQVIIERMRDFYSDVDLVALPVSQVAPFPVEWEYPTTVAGKEMGDYLEWMASCYLITVTHLPAISLPAGFTPGGLPVGLQLVGPPGGDVELIEAALSFEQAADVRRRPPLVAKGPTGTGQQI